MNLQWGYNNVYIKEGNKQKTAFTIYLGVYESTVMFFGLTNSLVTFQAMINDILRDLINIEDVAVFMDDILIGTENERGHDEIVEKVLRRMKANDPYIKLEKYVQKVKKIDFLGLPIGVEGIKMQEKRVIGVLEWLTLLYDGKYLII